MKKYLFVGIGVFVVVVLGVIIAFNITREPIYFEGKKLPIENVEEIIGDRLEDENGIDFKVYINEDKGE